MYIIKVLVFQNYCSIINMVGGIALNAGEELLVKLTDKKIH
jgi:hypothetical protein